MKIFIIAFACEPDRTSEPGVGWNVVCEMAKRHVVTVITRANNRNVIERYLNENPSSMACAVNFIYFDLADWLCRLKKKVPYGAQIYQELWNRAVAKRFALEMNLCDVVHQLTFGAAFFTPYAAKCAKHFVWGPIGGGDRPISFAFLRRMGLKSLMMEMIYRVVSSYSCRGAFFVNSYRKDVSAVIFRTHEFLSRMRTRGGQKRVSMLETAYIDEVRNRTFDNTRRPLKVLMLGRLMPHKGVMFAIEAFARFLVNGGEGELTVCGSGVLLAQMKQLVRKFGLEKNVRFMGQVAHDEAMRIMSSCDILLHLSFREGGSWSILEAMAHGLPVICQRASGMDDMVGHDCGTKILADRPETLVAGAVAALTAYFEYRMLIATQGRNAQALVDQEFRWPRLADRIDQVYQEVRNG